MAEQQVKQVTVAREKKTFEFFGDIIHLNLLQVFKQMFPDKGKVDMEKDFLLPMWTQCASGDDLLKSVYDKCNGAVDSFQLFMIACAYWTEAGRASKTGDPERAWSYAMDAMHYCASAKFSDSFDRLLPRLQEELQEYALFEKSSRGGSATNEAYRIIGAEAVRRVKARGEKGERWESYTKAAEAVLPELKDVIAQNIKHYTAPDGGIKAIAGRLIKADEIAPYITQKQKRGRPAKKGTPPRK